MPVLAAIDTATESFPIGGMLWQTILVMLVFCALAAGALSHVRYRRIMAAARDSLESGGSQDAFALAITDRIGFLGKKLDPFGILLIEHATETVADESELQKFLVERVGGQLRAEDRLIHLENDRLGMLVETDLKRSANVAERIVRGLEKEHLHLSSGARVAMKIRIAVTAFPECSQHAVEIVDSLYRALEQAAVDQHSVLVAAPGEEELSFVLPGEITENKIEHEVVVAEGQSHLLDELTGVLKSSRVGPAIQKFIARLRRDELPASVVVVDVDALEQYNQHYGRSAGDQILKSLSLLLMRHCRESDLIGRLGGEEFIVLMSCPPDQALRAVVRMTDAVKRHVLEHGGNRLRFTVGAGVAGYPQHGGNPVVLYDRAILALESAKKRGRNSCMMYDASMEQVAARRRDPVDAL